MRTIRMLELAVVFLLIRAVTLAAQAPAATAPRWPSDAFVDAGARHLVLRALALRDSAAAGLLGYQATATERTHVGIAITRRLPLRARTLYHREQVARVAWQRNGDSRVIWMGRRESAPTTGDAWSSQAPFGLEFDIVDELDLDDIGIDVLFDPLGDRMDVFEAEFVQPVSVAGLELYRFASGDTMQIVLPPPGRTITIVEVVVRPRTAAWEAVEGSIWFDRETGVLARAAFRPSDVWDWEVREPGDLDDVPGFLKPGVGTVRSIVVEYGLFDGRWWLPRRVVAEGVLDWGHGLVRMPLTVEWTMADHQVNKAPGPDFSPGPQLVPVGRDFSGNDQRRRRTEYFAPAGVDLSRTPELPPPLVEGQPVAFSTGELEALVARIEDSAGPPPSGPPQRPAHAVLTSLRYDRVRGLSAGYRAMFDAGPLRVSPNLRLATGVPDLFGRVEVSRRAATIALFRTLADASDWNVADGLGNTAATLLFGNDGGDYYRILGASLGWQDGDTPFRWSLEGFAERHRPIARQTSLSVATLGGGSLRPNLAADRLDLFGARGELAGQLGTNAQAGILNWRLRGEATVGYTSYGRVMASMRVTGPLTDRSAGALEVGGGVAGNEAPLQRHFFLGGAGTLRGVRENAVVGPAFWLVRAEAGRGLPGMRAILFLDFGWAGERADLTATRPTGGAGLGASFMDGLFRIDLARGVVRSNAWRIYFHLDALL